MLRQQDNLDEDRYIALILSKEDLENYVSEDLADQLFNDDIFRQYFENNIMQDFALSLETAIEDSK